MNLRKLFGLDNVFMDWESYKAKIDFIDDFYFQQNTRKESIKNSPPIGKE